MSILEVTLLICWLSMTLLALRLEAIIKRKNANIKFWKTLAEAYEAEKRRD